MVKKMDRNETIEGIEDKWALVGEPVEAEVCYAFGWEVGVESLYDGLQGAKAMKTRGAVGEKLKYHYQPILFIQESQASPVAVSQTLPEAHVKFFMP